MTVSEMLERISSEELAEWMVFYEEEPWGTEIDLLGDMMIYTLLANVYRAKGQPPVRLEDVMPTFKRRKSADELLMVAEQANMMFGGTDNRGNDR